MEFGTVNLDNYEHDYEHLDVKKKSDFLIHVTNQSKIVTCNFRNFQKDVFTIPN